MFVFHVFFTCPLIWPTLDPSKKEMEGKKTAAAVLCKCPPSDHSSAMNTLCTIFFCYLLSVTASYLLDGLSCWSALRL